MVFGNLSGTDIAFNESDINYSGSSDILNERDIYDSELSDIFNTTAAVDVVTELPFRIETLINSTRDTVGKCWYTEKTYLKWRSYYLVDLKTKPKQ